MLPLLNSKEASCYDAPLPIIRYCVVLCFLKSYYFVDNYDLCESRAYSAGFNALSSASAAEENAPLDTSNAERNAPWETSNAEGNAPWDTSNSERNAPLVNLTAEENLPDLTTSRRITVSQEDLQNPASNAHAFELAHCSSASSSMQ